MELRSQQAGQYQVNPALTGAPNDGAVDRLHVALTQCWVMGKLTPAMQLAVE